jgi:hypothetical protein
VRRLFLCLLFLLLPIGASAQKKIEKEEGQFRIYSGSSEIGSERYAIVSSQDSSSSTSVTEYRNPGDKRQKILLQTSLSMDSSYTPQRYELKTDVDGRRGAIKGEFSPRQAMFEYDGPQGSRKSGLLVGDQYTLLDTNVFHHFVFLARLLKPGTKQQRFEVLVPQEQENGVLTLREVANERVSVFGKSYDTRHVEANSGSVLIDLWVDDHRILRRLAVRDKGINVLRVP